MPSCELCGRDVDETTKTRIEGASLKVCNSCADMGEEVETATRKKSGGSSRSARSQNVLVDGYGGRIKEAREDEGISIQELADDLNEKSSLISKLEKEELKPDKPLARKLGKRLDVELYTNPEVSDVSSSSSSGDTREATVGDVAEVKE